MSGRRAWPGWLIVLVYLLVGSLYAVATPRWQVPDEPAHYNYIRALAAGRWPVMEMGDYDQALLERLTAEKFPPHLSVDALEYEDHQPPLYYLLATPLYLLFGGALLPLRLLSVAMGAVAVMAVMGVLRELAPARPGVAWLGGGVVAFLPQFVAMTAGVNNDALTLALLWGWLWLALRYLRGAASRGWLAALLAALLITKTTGYGGLVLTPLVVVLRRRRLGETWRWAARELVWILLPALVVGGLWWGRNVAVYGWPDVMGLRRHQAVVVGQPRTAEWIARMGVVPFLAGALRTTLRSFWGQFGWMGVVVDARLYRGAAIFFALAGVSAAAWLVETLRRGPSPAQRVGLWLLGSLAGITLAMFVGYNLTFVQHQGRYLFPALPALAWLIAEGLYRLAERRWAALLTAGGMLALGGLGAVGLMRGDLPLWTMALVGAATVAVGMCALLPRRFLPLLAAALLAGMAGVDLWCLYGFIVPMLT